MGAGRASNAGPSTPSEATDPEADDAGAIARGRRTGRSRCREETEARDAEEELPSSLVTFSCSSRFRFIVSSAYLSAGKSTAPQRNYVGAAGAADEKAGRGRNIAATTP